MVRSDGGFIRWFMVSIWCSHELSPIPCIYYEAMAWLSAKMRNGGRKKGEGRGGEREGLREVG